MEFARLSSSRNALVAVALSCFTCLLVAFMFTPRVALWQGLGLYSAGSFPEVNRANATLRQLAEPHRAERSETNRVISWRLFFPFLGHVLGLSSRTFLALPHLGCVLVLTFLARLLMERRWSSLDVATALAVLASSSWFFVSSGWLAYFDSWCVLGMLLVAFARNRTLMIAAVLVSPWVDERFVFALPLSLLVRREVVGEPHDRRVGDWVLCALALTPWILCRLVAFTWFDDPVTVSHTQAHLQRRGSMLARSLLSGAWHAFRWGWAFVVAALVLRRRAVVMSIAALAALAPSYALADDLSRATMVVLPLVISGAMALRDRLDVGAGRSVLLALAALNLLSPAKHIIADTEVPIYYFHREWERLRNPPVEVDPRALNDLAVSRFKEGNRLEAEWLFDSALALAPDDVQARRNRGVLHMMAGEWERARADFEHALTLSPRDPNLLHLRARVRLRHGDRDGAREDLQLALSTAAAEWPARNEAIADLQLAEARN